MTKVKLERVVNDEWKTVNTLHFCEPELQRQAYFVSGCANSGGFKEVKSFLPTTLGVQRQDTGKVTVPNNPFFSKQLTQQVK